MLHEEAKRVARLKKREEEMLEKALEQGDGWDGTTLGVCGKCSVEIEQPMVTVEAMSERSKRYLPSTSAQVDVQRPSEYSECLDVISLGLSTFNTHQFRTLILLFSVRWRQSTVPLRALRKPSPSEQTARLVKRLTIFILSVTFLDFNLKE